MQVAQPFPATTAYRPPVAIRPGFVGHLLVVLAGLALGASFVLSGEPLLSLFVAGPIVVLPVVAAAVATRFRHKGHIAGIAVGLAAIAVPGPAVTEMFDHPDSFFDFVPVLCAVAGGLLMAGTSIASLSRHTIPSGYAGALSAAILCVVLVGGTASGIATFANREHVSAADRVGATEFRMKGVDFETEALTVKAGQPLKFVVENDDPIVHTFTAKELGVDVTLKAGSGKLVEFTPTVPGTYEIICKISGHEGSMKTILTVE
ncbi:MAG: cupredoxin domain-containing protein [Hyphomicrobiales bacterium]